MERVLLVAVLCGVLGCGGEVAPRVEDGTARMVERLREAAQRVTPEENRYANLERVAMMRARPRPAETGPQAVYDAMLAQELLYAGETEAAIEGLERVREVLAEQPDLFRPEFGETVRDVLAIAYMRLGEQQNCLLNHTAASCLFPITEEGLHRLEEGSRNAVRLYTEILNDNPDDLTSRWLLNVAHMTLGEYPEGVPPAWRIPPDALTSDADVGRFRDVAPMLGVDVTGLSGGGIVEDFDGDGHLDLLVSSWGLHDQIRYFRNTGEGGFEERTDEAGLTGLTGGLNMVHADYDNDGDPDVLVLRGAWLKQDGAHPNSLLRNDGEGTFSDVTESAGLLSFHPTQTAAWGDYDNDGDLDLFIGNESGPEPHPCELYRNNGEGMFTDVASEAGLDAVGYFKGSVWGDYDNDGDLDLYLSDLTGPNRLYRNDGAGGFTDVAREAGVTEPVSSFPTWFWDYDNDGWLDLLVFGYEASAGDVAAEYLGLPVEAERPRLYRNTGQGAFADVTAEARLDRVMYAMGSNFGDLDNDGWLDFYAGTGDPDYRALMPNLMFRNAGGRVFEDVTASGGFGHLQKGHAVSFADIDHDGDQDVHAVMGGALVGDQYQNVLFENPGHGNRFVKLLLEGERSNRMALGARIRVDVETPSGERSIHRVVGSGGSFGGSPFRLEIGLGQAEAITRVKITWPATGEVQVVEDLEPDRAYRIREGQAGVEPVELPGAPFRSRPGFGTTHEEHEPS